MDIRFVRMEKGSIFAARLEITGTVLKKEKG